MHQSTYYERKTLANWSCQDVDSLYEKISKVGSGTYGYLYSPFPLFTLTFAPYSHNTHYSFYYSAFANNHREVNKARLRSDPTKLVALKKIKDQSETQGVRIFSRISFSM